MSQVIGHGRYGRETYPVSSGVGSGGGVIFPDQIIQQEGGTIGAPAGDFVWQVRPTDPAVPAFGAFIFAGLFNTTFDYVQFYGSNPSRTFIQPYTVLAIEQDFEPTPGVHQIECYFESALFPGDVNSFVRPFGFVHWRTGPNANKVQPAIQYTSSLVITGGTSPAPVLQLTVQDNTILVDPSTYNIIANGNFGINTLNAGRAALFAHGTGDFYVRATGNAGYLLSDTIFFGQGDETLRAVYNTAANVFVPLVDGTGSIGDNPNRWALVRAVTITSGDLHLQDEERGAHWILREEPDGILAINEVTKKVHRLSMTDDNRSYEVHANAHAARMKALEDRASAATKKLEKEAEQRERARLGKSKCHGG